MWGRLGYCSKPALTKLKANPSLINECKFTVLFVYSFSKGKPWQNRILTTNSVYSLINLYLPSLFCIIKIFQKKSKHVSVGLSQSKKKNTKETKAFYVYYDTKRENEIERMRGLNGRVYVHLP